MTQHVSIAHPEYLTISGPGEVCYRGANQDWFPGERQRRAGCGPTAAALMLAYLARSRPALGALYPEGCMEQGPFTAHMCRVWAHMTPGNHGLNRAESFVEGLSAYGASVGVPLAPRMLALPAARTKRPPFADYADFLAAGLSHDCPVAFLNLHNGAVKNLDYWHWITVVALEGDNATALDSGHEITIDLALWHATSKKRGAFVTFPDGVAE